MATTVYTNDQYYTDIATAIRNKNGSSTQYKPSEMAGAINALIVSGSAPSLQEKTVSPSTSQQIITYDSGYNGLRQVTVNAISPIKTATNVTVSGATVSIPAGYYSSAISKSVASGTAGTPTATKGTVANNAITITPTVVNTAGYIAGGTKTGNAIIVNAGELVSGTLSVTSNGEKDVTNYASINVNIPTGSTINNQDKTVSPSTLQQSISADAGYTGLGTVTINAIQTESKSATPTTSQQTISPSSGKFLTSVVVNAIATETKTATPSTATQNITPSTGKYLTKVTVNPIPSGYIIPSGSQTVTSNNTYDVTSLAEMVVNVPTGSTINNQNKTVTPTTSQQSITADSGYTGLGTVTVNAMPTMTLPTAAASSSSGTNKATIGRSTSAQYINIPVGYNSAVASYTISAVANGSVANPTAAKGTVSNNSISITPSVTSTTGYITGGTKTGTAVTVTASELVSGNKAITANGTNIDVKNYATVSVNVPSSGTTINNQDKSVTPTEEMQQITADSGYTGLGTVNVGAISSTYVGSGITQRSSSSLTASGATVTVPAGYYEAAASKAVASMTLPTSASTTSSGTSKLTITPTTSARYINIPTGYNATASYYTIGAIPSNYIIPSGNKEITANGTNIDVKNYATVSVTVPATTPNLQAKTGINPSTSSQTITADSGYDGLSSVQINAMTTMSLPTTLATSATSGYTRVATVDRSTSTRYINIPAGYHSGNEYYQISAVANGSATNSGSVSGSSATISTGTNTITLQKAVSITPAVTAGYISSGTAGNVTVSLTASVTTKAAATITPGTSNQTIASGTYLTGTQTIVGDADLIGSNIISTANIFGVQGTVVINKYYTGSSAPASSLGSNGDIYIQQ